MGSCGSGRTLALALGSVVSGQLGALPYALWNDAPTADTFMYSWRTCTAEGMATESQVQALLDSACD